MDSQWLRNQFEINPDKTKTGLAKAINLDPPAVSKILNGTRQIKAQEYMLMRHYFGLPSDGHSAIIKSNGSHNATSGEAGGLHESSNPPGDSEWMIPGTPRTSAAPEKIRVLQVRDTMMEPEFRKGEYVLVDISDKKPDPPGVFIVSDGFGQMMRHCEFVMKPGEEPEIKISARGSNFQTQTLKPNDFLIIGRVIARLNMI